MFTDSATVCRGHILPRVFGLFPLPGVYDTLVWATCHLPAPLLAASAPTAATLDLLLPENKAL